MCVYNEDFQEHSLLNLKMTCIYSLPVMLFLCYTLPPAVTASDQRIHSVPSESPCRETSSPLPQNAELEERGDGLTHLGMGHWRDSGSLVEEAL